MNDEEKGIIDFPELNDADAGGYKPVPNGKYKVVVSNVTPGKSEAGNTKFNLELTIIDNENRDFNGRKIFHTLALTPTAAGMVKQALLGLGIDTSKFKGFPATELYKKPKATVSVKIKTQEGYDDKNVVSYWVIPDELKHLVRGKPVEGAPF
jgi:hypothetical protein